ncbi:MAG: HEAT repeat domain-containing protein [Planctomycetota bacterium]|jgi:hypothetical protein
MVGAWLRLIGILSLVGVAAGETYTVNGWKVEARLVPQKPTVMVGEPLYLEFIIENKSGRDLHVMVGGNTRNRLGRTDRYRIETTNELGKRVPVPDAGPSMGGPSGPRKIPSGGRYVKYLFFPNWAQIDAPGSYTVVCHRALNLNLATDLPRDWHKVKWFDQPTKLTTRVRVVPLDRERMGAVIDKLAAAMFDGYGGPSERATKSLAYIRDERVIPPFLQALRTKYSVLMYAAVNALAQYDSDAALEGVMWAATKMTAADITNVTTPAVGKQAAMWQHPHRAVRLEVAHELGTMDTAESTALLKKMERDPDGMVRGEVLRYLSVRR